MAEVVELKASDLAAMLCSRVCHDLISPVGAIGNGLEVLADPTQAENLLKPCGRGILIIRSFMDEVFLSRREGGGNRLHMLKRLPEPTS